MKSNPQPISIIPFVLVALLLAGSRLCPAANVSKGNNGTAMNSSASWVGGTGPGPSDIALWDTNVTSASSASLGGDVSWGGLALGNYPPYATYVNDPVGSVTITNAGLNTLTLGASGIDLSISTNWNLTITNNNISVTGNQTWNVYAGKTATIGGNVSGTGNILKLGAGILNLCGTNGFSGQLIGGGGQVNLNFNTATAPTNNMLNPSQPLVFDYDGAAITLNGKAGTTNTQMLNGVQLKSGVGSINTVPGGSGGSNYVDIGAITRSRGGGAIDLGPLLAAGPIHTTATNDASGIIGPWATIASTAFSLSSGANTYATNWASVDANGYVTNYNGWTILSGDSPTIANGATSNVRIDSGSTGNSAVGAGTTTVITLGMNDTVNARTVSIPAGNIVRLGAKGGVLRTPSAKALTIGTAAGVGVLTAGGADNTAGELIINSQSGANNKGSANFTINSSITDNGSGSVSISIIGGDQVSIRGANTYSGGTYIRAGRVDINAAGVYLGMGPIYISGAPVSAFIQNGVGQNLGGAAGNSQIGGSLYFSNSGNYTNDLYLSGAGGVDTAGGILRTPGTQWGTITLQGDTMLPAGTYRGRITGTGNLYFRQNNTAHLYGTNDYVGDTVLMNLIVECHNISNLPPTSVVVVGQGSGVVGTANINFNTLLRIDASQKIAGLADGTFMSPTNSRTVDIGGGATATLTLSNNTRNLYYSGAISNSSGTLSLVKDGTYTQTLAGTGAYSGTTRIANGTLVLGNAGAIGSSVLDLSGGTGGSLSFGSLTAVAVGALQGTNNLALTNATGAAVTFAVGKDDGQSYTYSGVLGGNGGLTKNGNDYEYLDNTNTYTGTTLVNAATLYLTANGAIPNSSQIIISNGAMLDVTAPGGLTLNGAARQILGGNGGVNGPVTASTGSSLSPGNAVGTLTITGDLTLNGGVTNLFDLSGDPTGVSNPNDKIIVNGNLNLRGLNPVKINPYLLTLGNGEYPLIQYSTLATGSEANLQLQAIGGYTMYLTNDTSIPAIAVVILPSHTPASVTWRGNGSNNNWDLTTVDWFNAGLVAFFNGDSVTFDDTGSNNIPINLVGSVGPAVVDVNATKNYTFGGTGKIGGATALTKDGSGTLTLLGNNDYVGGTVIINGTVHVGNGGSTGSIGSGNIIDNGALILDRSGSLSFNSTLTGNGNLTLQGGGTFSFIGDATGFSGPVAVTNAIVSAVDFANLGTSGNLTLNGGTLQTSTGAAESPTWNIALGAGGGTINHANPLTIGDTVNYPITGIGSFTKAGSGKMTLATSNSYSGLTVVAGGTLQVDSGGTTAWIPNGVSLTGGSLVYERSDSYTQNGFVRGSSAASSITVNSLSAGNTNYLNFAAGNNSFNSIANSSGGGTLILDGPANSTNTLAGTISSSATATLDLKGAWWNVSGAFSPIGSELIFDGGTVLVNNPGGAGVPINVPSVFINSGGLILNGGLRIANAADNQTLNMNGGVLSITTNVTYGFRFANNAGGGGNQANLAGYFSFTGIQTGGLLSAPGSGELRFSMGGSGPANPGAAASWTMTGGQIIITNAGPAGGSIFLGADTSGNGTTTFSLGGTGRLLVYSIVAAQAGAKQVFNWTGGTNTAFTIDASNLQSTNAPGMSGMLYNNGGALVPGDFGSAGRTTINGSYDITAGSALLDIDVGGLSQATILMGATNSSDNVQITGSAVLGGNLRIHQINGFEPLAPAGQSIVILSATNITGNFANLDVNGRLAVAGDATRSYHVTVMQTNVVLDGYQTPTPQAYFTNDRNLGTNSLTVTFTNLSNGSGLTNLWNFGDGSTSTSTAVTVTHTYATPSTNTVSLTVGSSLGVSNYTRSNSIVVVAQTTPTSAPITYTANGNQLILNWPNGLGWVLEAQTNNLGTGLYTNWVRQTSVSSPFTNTVNPANGTVFYRLVYP